MMARLISAWLGGVSGMPIAWRTMLKTTTMRTNGVMQIAKAGISATKASDNRQAGDAPDGFPDVTPG